MCAWIVSSSSWRSVLVVQAVSAVFQKRTCRLAMCSFSDQGGRGGTAHFFSAALMALPIELSILSAAMYGVANERVLRRNFSNSVKTVFSTRWLKTCWTNFETELLLLSMLRRLVLAMGDGRPKVDFLFRPRKVAR